MLLLALIFGSQGSTSSLYRVLPFLQQDSQDPGPPGRGHGSFTFPPTRKSQGIFPSPAEGFLSNFTLPASRTHWALNLLLKTRPLWELMEMARFRPSSLLRVNGKPEAQRKVV